MTSGKWKRFRFALVGLLILWPPVAWVAAKLLIVRAPLEHADAIVLLSGSRAIKERAFQASQLYREGYAPKIILTNDGIQGAWSRAEQRNLFYYESTQAELVRLGVPKEKVEILLDPVYDTFSEATLVRKHAEERGLQAILIVTSAYHSRRALWTYRRVFRNTGLRIGLESAPPGWQMPRAATWWLYLRGWQNVPGEYVKMIYYRLRFTGGG